jgi:hypothetical protein
MPGWRRHRLRLVGALAIAAGLLVACSASPNGATTTPAPLAALGVELPASQLPWSQVGPGWMLATWSPAPGLGPGQTPPAGQPAVAPVTLYLLDPAGGRYAITTFPLLPPVGPGDPGHTPFLADWSPNGRHALFEDYGSDPTGPGYTTMTDVDLTSGDKHSFTVGTGGAEGAYTRPNGEAIIVSTFVSPARGWTLERVDLTGKRQLLFPTDQLGTAGKYNGGYLESADGTQLVLGTANGLVLMGNDGVVGRRLPVPGQLTDCRPVRWWTATVILTRCDASASSSTSQLWRVPLPGGDPVAETAVDTGQQDSGFGNDLGDADAWQLPSGTFLQSQAGCGPGFLSRLTPDMHTTAVTVPGVTDSGHVSVIGATADTLVLRAHMGCGSGISLLTYNPAANTTTVLLGPPVNGGGVQNAILYASTRS